MSEAKAVVLGLYGANALGNIRSLGYEKIPVIGIHADKNPCDARRSKFLHEGHVLGSEDQLLETLISIGERQDRKATLHCTGDNYVLFCAAHADVLSPYFHVPVSRSYPLAELLDKNGVLEIAGDAGLEVPAHTALSIRNYHELIFPVMVKPLNSVVGGKKDMQVFELPEDLDSQVDRLLETHGDMSVQEYIPHTTRDSFSVHAYNLQGRVVIGAMLQFREALGLGDVSSSMIKEVRGKSPEADAIKRFVQEVDFQGPMDIDFMRRQGTEEYYFLEANYRAGAGLMLDTVAGVNFPAMVHFDQTGKTARAEELSERGWTEGLRWVDERKVIRSLLVRSPPSLESLRNIRAFTFFDQRDLMPLIDSIINTRRYFR